MTGSAERPILFLDVDGPLIPFGGTGQYPTHQTALGNIEPLEAP
ncbi:MULTISPECIES: hypothetical protein [Streptomyces]|nr:MULTISPECIES: hypothetical protein [Streptomyces]MCX5309272.1 hypothetical protein [Streptomyces sp. NBC_00160]